MTGLDEHKLGTLLKEAVPRPDPSRDLAGRARRQALRGRRRRVTYGTAALVVAVLAPALAIALRPGGSGTTGPTDRPARSVTAPAPDSMLCGRACDPARVARAIARPLHLPTVAAGGSCPVSPTRHFRGGAGFSGAFDAVGRGPLFLFAFRGRHAHALRMTPADRGWLGTKVVWVFGRTYAGPLLLRGGRIDATGGLRFDHYLGAAPWPRSGRGPFRELLYVRGGLQHTDGQGLESEPSMVYVRTPGCYAVQVDGVGFSDVLVFRSVRR